VCSCCECVVDRGHRVVLLVVGLSSLSISCSSHARFTRIYGLQRDDEYLSISGLIAASSGLLDAGVLQSPAGLENGNGPVPMKVASGASGSGYANASGLEEGLLGLHVSGAALAH